MSENKRKRESAPTPDDIMLVGKEVQNKSGRSLGAPMSEDRAFRDFFGTSAIVVLALWQLLVETELLPEGGTMMHLLWTLFFFNVYPKQAQACSTAGASSGAIDPKTWRKYVWPFVFAIADLESVVIDFEGRKRSGSLNDCLLSVDCTDVPIPNQGDPRLLPSSSRENLPSGMRLLWTLWRGTLFGSTEGSLQENGTT